MSFNFISLINDSCHVSMYVSMYVSVYVSEEPVCSTLSFSVSEMYPLSLRQFKVWEYLTLGSHRVAHTYDHHFGSNSSSRHALAEKQQ